ncbi:MAG: hypothetical protein ACHQNT_00550 [Bacteroidia bacterium]
MMKKIYTEQSDFLISDATRKEIDYKLKEEKLIYKIKEELYCQNGYRIFFDHYEEESTHVFIEEYAKRKAYYILNGQRILSEEERGQLYFNNLAGYFIWQIQQKKLFDLQCLWRAGKTELKKISVTKDFLLLETQIKDCKLVDEITEADLELFTEYILSGDYSEINHAGSWQNFERIKAGDKMLFSTIPSWYEFYDKANGTNGLLSLPDEKGEKEKFYLGLLKQNQANHDEKKETEEQPSLKFNYKTLDFFINTFEDKQLLKYFYAAEKNHPELNANDELNEALYLLQLSEKIIPVQKNKNWKEAVINAALQFKKKKIAEALIQVFDEYKMRLKAGIPFQTETDLLRQQIAKAKADRYKEQILKARKLNGESADFNF